MKDVQNVLSPKELVPLNLQQRSKHINRIYLEKHNLNNELLLNKLTLHCAVLNIFYKTGQNKIYKL